MAAKPRFFPDLAYCPSVDAALDASKAGEAVRSLGYWPELFDTLVGMAHDEQEFGPYFDLGGEG